ncbi:trace amine-associated receptor 7d [Hydra vulgaris]|uniref:trace amine-associated receptor 7d n=1 Tax=Hydra vulgaris TaxID=6087 RepID=UPI001F5EDFF1|nr:trace amine-associated receptor 7d-like [Hydra vulgaris]
MSNSTEAVTQPLSVVVPLMFSCILAVILNIAVCYLILRVRSLKTATNVFTFSLCLCNILIAGILIPSYCYFNSSTYFKYLLTITILVYVCNLTAVTSERLLSITYPLNYTIFVTKKNTKLVAAFAWLISIIYSLLPLIWSSDTRRVVHKMYVFFTLVLFLVAPLIFVCFTYIKVCIEIKKMLNYSKKCMNLNNFQYSPSVENIGPKNDSILEECNNRIPLAENLLKSSKLFSNVCRQKLEKKSSLLKHLKSKMSELKLATAFGIVALTYMVNWVPVIILSFMEAINRLDLIPTGLEEFSIFIMAFNTLIDALIYALFLKNFRKTIKLFLRQLKTKNESCFCFV